MPSDPLLNLLVMISILCYTPIEPKNSSSPHGGLIVSHIFLLDTGGAMIGFCIFI